MAALEKRQTDEPAYRAFISYSHSDKAIAKWLHSELERYRLPKKLIGNHTALGPVPKRLSPIFRDVDELPASGNLGTELQDALTRSLFLIVICSPASARSKWVNEEIRQFKLMHGANKVLALIVDGVPNATADTMNQECFAPALKFTVAPSGVLTEVPSEPIAADLRKSADGKRLAKLKLVCGLTGLRLDDLVQREAARRIRILVQVSVVSVVAAVFAVGLAIYANDRRLEADKQRTIAEQESATARAVSDFLVKTFASGNSVQKNPNTITAKSILDRGAQRITVELQDQPLVQSRLSATIALAYNNLGLFNQAIDLVNTTAARSGVEHANVISVKAESLLRLGELDASMEAAKYAQDLAAREQLGAFDRDSAKVRADAARIQARIYYKRGQYDAGLKAFGRSLHELENMPQPNDLDIANTLQNRALLLSDAGEMEWATADLARAKVLVLKSGEGQDILLGQIALAQAQVNFLSGNLEPALEQIKTAIAVMQGILEDDNPTLADALSMQGQILHAMGILDEAKKALTQAVHIYTKAYGGRHYLSGIAEVYLGLIAGDQHDLPAALAHFDEAKLHYDASYGEVHANHGDLLVNRATVLASAGDMVRANQDCEEGMRILVATLGEKAAFTQQLQAVCDELKKQ
ncbi:TIR domain-containing protein [Paraglaciecola sp. 25GB23A]|uniref:TIR domain-containing protein n=1 Tax=Paraglaciecola sp. 25GB23A TaxID=3156068 RepID=UPI0032AF300A